MKKIMHISTGLENGGAEGVLYRLCKHDKQNTHIVISLIGEGKYGPLLEAQGIKVYCLNMPAGKVTLKGLITLYKLIKKNPADVIQTWMYHADLLGGLVAKLAGKKSIFWNVRHSTIDTKESKKTLVIVAKACAFLSRWIPNQIIYCAQEAKSAHQELGYDNTKAIVIGNGYDLELFNIDPPQGAAFRQELSLTESQLLLTMIGRYNPQKDHLNLIKSLSLVKKSGYNFKLVLIGHKMDDNNQTLLNQINQFGLKDNTILLGQRTDIPSVMNGADLNILSSSFGEGFPNVLAEAMACGTPCVTTKVGDAALIVGQTGWSVEPREHIQLAAAIEDAITQQQDKPTWAKRTMACRKRVEENFSIQNMIVSYHRAWLS